jgi:hypothetical protein
VPICLLLKWMKELPRLQAHARLKKRAITPRGIDQLHPIKNELLMWIFSQREQGLSIRNTVILLKVFKMLRDTFGAKSRVARLKAVARFMRKHNYVYPQKTNEATRNLQEVYQEAQEFLDFTRLLLHGPHRNRHWIFNMDQMPFYFSYHNLKTYEKCGTKTIHIRKTSNGTKRATGVFIITAAGNFLTPMIIFKGKPGGMIEKKELPKFDPSSIYACQDAAWMDERCMMLWVDQILGPYLMVNPPPPGIQPVILLDAYQCHMMALVIGKISKLGIEVIHIPGRCTGLCEPLDVSVNKPFKRRVRDLWEEWMTDMLNKEGEIHDAMHKEVAEWTAIV